VLFTVTGGAALPACATGCVLTSGGAATELLPALGRPWFGVMAVIGVVWFGAGDVGASDPHAAARHNTAALSERRAVRFKVVSWVAHRSSMHKPPWLTEILWQLD
jgi:hypothetical protein